MNYTQKTACHSKILNWVFPSYSLTSLRDQSFLITGRGVGGGGGGGGNTTKWGRGQVMFYTLKREGQESFSPMVKAEGAQQVLM